MRRKNRTEKDGRSGGTARTKAKGKKEPEKSQGGVTRNRDSGVDEALQQGGVLANVDQEGFGRPVFRSLNDKRREAMLGKSSCTPSSHGLPSELKGHRDQRRGTGVRRRRTWLAPDSMSQRGEATGCRLSSLSHEVRYLEKMCRVLRPNHQPGKMILLPSKKQSAL